MPMRLTTHPTSAADMSPTEDSTPREPAPPATVAESETLGPNVYALIRRIQSGDADPAGLDPAERRECVDYLDEQGFDRHQIAATLRTSVRTITRDRTALRRKRAMRPTLGLGDELVGDLCEQTRRSIGRLVHLVRQPDTPAYARLWAEESMQRMQLQLIKTVFERGYARGGKGRLDHLLATDKDTHRRYQETDAADRARVLGRTLPPLPDPKEMNIGQHVEFLKAVAAFKQGRKSSHRAAP